jgi:hypothetical protein
MKRFLTSIAIIGGLAVLGGLFYGATGVRAANQIPLTGEHKRQIASNCTSAKASLQRLHQSDASLRVNRGQVYEFISTKLMARLNSRLALNRLDSGDLVEITAKYETALNDFRNVYQTYEEQLKSTLRTDCAENPEQFYHQVLDTREKRQAINETVEKLSQYIDEYYAAFDAFNADFTGLGQEEKTDE